MRWRQTASADSELQKRFTAVWRGRTVCLSDLYVKASCSHAAATVAANYPGTIIAPPSASQALVWPPPSS